MKPKEFKRGNVYISYINKTWTKRDLDLKSTILYLLVFFEIFCIITFVPSIMLDEYVKHRITLILCFVTFSITLILLSLMLGYSSIYGNKEDTIHFYEWLQNIEDIKVKVDNNDIYLLVKQGRVYQTYTIESFLQPYTSKYKIVRANRIGFRCIEFKFNFDDPSETKVILH